MYPEENCADKPRDAKVVVSITSAFSPPVRPLWRPDGLRQVVTRASQQLLLYQMLCLYCSVLHTSWLLEGSCGCGKRTLSSLPVAKEEQDQFAFTRQPPSCHRVVLTLFPFMTTQPTSTWTILIIHGRGLSC